MSKTFTIKSNMNDIDTAAMERAKTVTGYINQAASTIDPDQETATMLTNVNTRFNELVCIAPRNEYFAGNAVCISLGYTILNQMLWKHRRDNSVKAPEPTIDYLNDAYGEMYEQRATDAQMHDNGMDKLPVFDAIPLLGVYKNLLRMQVGNTAYAADFPVRMPHEIVHEMLTKENDQQLAQAYASLTAQEIAQSRAAQAIGAAMAKLTSSQKERNISKNKAEMDFVLNEFKNKCPDKLTDEVWATIPLWVQYKLVCSVFKQVVKAIAVETRKEPTGSANRDRLLALVDEMYLELEAASKTAEIKLAFALERLDERHDVLAKKVEAPKAEAVTE